MLEILQTAEGEKRSKDGPNPKLMAEEMLFAVLEYWRKYHTYAHIAIGYGTSESQMFRIVRWVEDILVKNGTLSLPGKKSLVVSNAKHEIVLVNATKTPIERPKRGKNSTVLERKSDIH